MMSRLFIPFVLIITVLGLSACDSAPPTLMKASIQFDSDEKRDHHIEHMRTHHMHALKHKRDETMYQGIRTEDHSLKACINCHVPESYNGKVLRHTDPEHFCSTCHNYVAEKLNCFECHVDHPVKVAEMSKLKSDEKTSASVNNSSTVSSVNNFNKLSNQALIDLAFKYSKSKDSLSKTSKMAKSGGVSYKEDNPVDTIKKNTGDVSE